MTSGQDYHENLLPSSSEGMVLDLWKRAIIVPISIINPPNALDDLRPIT